MSNQYYKEDFVKDTKYRQDYVEGIEEYLKEKKLQAEKERTTFISPEKYSKNPDVYRKEFCKMLGFPLTEARIMPERCEKTFVARDGNVDIYRMQFVFWGRVKFYGIYFEQIENTKETPFLFGFHGGSGTPEIVSSMHLDSANYNHLVRRITDKGANVFAPQFLLWNVERYGNQYSRANIDGKLRQLGGSVTALELYFLSGVLDYFLANETVAADKIGVAGLSYGGMYAVHFAAIDTRVKVCYSCSWVDDSFVNSLADWSYFNAQRKFTAAEVLGLIAPRALFVGMGDKDSLFDCKRTTAECEKAWPYFRALGKEDHFKWMIFEGNHETDRGDEWLDFVFEKIME